MLNISFILQGPPKKIAYYSKCLRSISDFFPGSQVVIALDKIIEARNFIENETSSTDLDLEITYVEYSDPGPVESSSGRNLNLNRQIIGVQEAIKACNRKYICKVRPEIYFETNELIDYIDLMAEKNEFFIIASSITTKDPLVSKEMRYHISDWFFFGSNTEISKLYDIPVAKYPNSFLNDTGLNMTTENYITTNLYSRLEQKEMSSLSEDAQENSIDFMLKFFLIRDPKELGFNIQHAPYKFPFGENGMYSFRGADYDFYFKKKYGKYPEIKSKQSLFLIKFKKFFYKVITWRLIKILIKIKGLIRFG